MIAIVTEAVPVTGGLGLRESFVVVGVAFGDDVVGAGFAGGIHGKDGARYGYV